VQLDQPQCVAESDRIARGRELRVEVQPRALSSAAPQKGWAVAARTGKLEHLHKRAQAELFRRAAFSFEVDARKSGNLGQIEPCASKRGAQTDQNIGADLGPCRRAAIVQGLLRAELAYHHSLAVSATLDGSCFTTLSRVKSGPAFEPRVSAAALLAHGATAGRRRWSRLPPHVTLQPFAIETSEQAGAEFKVPEKYKGYTVNHRFGGVAANIQLIYDELKKK
jgi:hypothetical protein